MFTLYKFILIRFDGWRYKSKNMQLIKKKNKNNGNEKGNNKPLNLNCNYISSAQIYESNKFFKNYYFLNLN